jgi:hypothetical protein
VEEAQYYTGLGVILGVDLRAGRSTPSELSALGPTCRGAKKATRQSTLPM